MSIRDKAILVALRTSLYVNAAEDEKAVDSLIKKFGAEANVHKYKKVLLPPHALAGVRGVRTAARKYWFDNTLPWANEGVRLLPASRYQSFVEKMRAFKTEYEHEVERFLNDYPKLKSDARKRLASLFDEHDFPTSDRMRRKFRMQLDVTPIPSGEDFRVSLSESERKEIEREVEARVKETAKASMQALVGKLQEQVQHLSERLKEKDAIVTKRSIENIVESVRESDEFNVVEDKQVTALHTAAAKLVDGVSLDTLKADEKARKQFTDKADALLARMAAYTGAQE